MVAWGEFDNRPSISAYFRNRDEKNTTGFSSKSLVPPPPCNPLFHFMKQRGEKRITALFSERGRSFQANRARFSFTTYSHSSNAHFVPIAILPSPGERERRGKLRELFFYSRVTLWEQGIQKSGAVFFFLLKSTTVRTALLFNPPGWSS